MLLFNKSHRFVDVHKFRGQNVAHRMPELLQRMRHYDHDSLVEFFMA